MKYEHLFEKGRIGCVETKNRIVMAPMGTPAMTGLHGTFSSRQLDYYERRAIGGVGLIITGVSLVNSKIEPWEMDGQSPMVTFDQGWKVRNFIQLTERVHDHGAKIFAQLTAGFGRVFPKSFLDKGGVQGIAPSPMPMFWRPDLCARPLTTEEIESLIDSFGKAAQIARASQFDGIELHGHEGYLIDQFISGQWNQRTDEYGGDFRKRMRFPLSIIETIQKRAGADFPIVFRIGVEHKIRGGRSREEGIRILQALETAGVSALHVDAGCYDNWYWPHPPIYQPPGCMVDMAEAAKANTSLPIITVGRLGYPQLADQILRDGKADFVAMGRALLADPDLPKKARLGRVEDIRPCIGCHECFMRIHRAQSISCAVNPQCGDEHRLTIGKAPEPKKVMVVGGGIGGMEAARVCALRGHEVVLYEKSEGLGGILKAASSHGFKKDLQLLLLYQVRQIRKQNGVTVKLNREATEDDIQEERPDVIFLACGSEPILPTHVQGLLQTAAVTAEDVFRGEICKGETAVVIGGGAVGCEAALHLAGTGWTVTVLEMLPAMASDLFAANREMLLQELRERGVTLWTEARAESVAAGRVAFSTPEGRRSLSHDLLVLAVGRRPVNDLFEAANRMVPEVHVIGDCLAPRKIKDAVWEAFKSARIV